MGAPSIETSIADELRQLLRQIVFSTGFLSAASICALARAFSPLQWCLRFDVRKASSRVLRAEQQTRLGRSYWKMAQENNLTFYPFAYALLDENLNDFCWYCLAERNEDSTDPTSQTVHLLRCSGCKTAYFCSKECQSNGWSDHKAECKAFSKGKPENQSGLIPDIEVRMLGRLTWRYKQILDGSDTKEKNFYLNRTSVRGVMDLCSHDSDMRADEKARRKFEHLLQQLKAFYGKKFLLDDETIFQLHCRNFINRHGISDRTYLREIGKGLYLDLCWYDHSCRPNSLYTHNGFIAVLRPLSSTVALPDRSTTFYTYIDLLQSREERQRALAESWYFDCQCARCVDESDHALTAAKCAFCDAPVNIFRGSRLKSTESLRCEHCGQQLEERRLQEGIVAMRQIDSLINGSDLGQDSAKALQFLDDLLNENSKILPFCNVYFVRLLRAVILRCESTDTERMLRYHVQAIDCMRLCYPANHPSLAYHLMNVGVFYRQAGQCQNACEFLREATAMFEFTLGKDHFLTKTAVEELEKVPLDAKP